MTPPHKVGKTSFSYIDLDKKPLAFVLRDFHCHYYWSERGKRWMFADVKFQELREEIGLSTHIIHYETRNYQQGIFISQGPVIEFFDRNKMLEFKLRL